MLAITIGAVAPIGSVLYHHTYIGPVLVIPPRLFRGRDHLFTILPQHFLCHVPTAPATPLLKTVFFTLDGKTGLVSGLVTGFQVWKYPGTLTQT